jgi:hypothetical protein
MCLWNFYQRFVPAYATTVARITYLLKGNNKSIRWGDSQVTAFLEITDSFTSGKMLVLHHYDLNRVALIETDALDCAIGGVVSWKL